MLWSQNEFFPFSYCIIFHIFISVIFLLLLEQISAPSYTDLALIRIPHWYWQILGLLHRIAMSLLSELTVSSAPTENIIYELHSGSHSVSMAAFPCWPILSLLPGAWLRECQCHLIWELLLPPINPCLSQSVPVSPLETTSSSCIQFLGGIGLEQCCPETQDLDMVCFHAASTKPSLKWATFSNFVDDLFLRKKKNIQVTED